MRAQLVRTASFSRRGSKNSNSRDDETDRDECSDSRSATPDTERAPNSPTFVHSPTDSESEPSTILSDHLYGWLKKRTSGGISAADELFALSRQRWPRSTETAALELRAAGADAESARRAKARRGGQRGAG